MPKLGQFMYVHEEPAKATVWSAASPDQERFLVFSGGTQSTTCRDDTPLVM
jgi:hypothetical protein